MRKLSLALLLGISVTASALQVTPANAASVPSLPEVFDQSVIIPFDFQNKAFMNGKKVDLYDSGYRIAQRNGQVLVPIRLLETLTSQSAEDGRWETIWQAKQPNVVTVRNSQLKRTVVFTVNSKTMTVNGESRDIQVAPQEVDGRIMLPLRTAAEAFGQRIDWLNGLIVIGKKPFDTQSQQTIAVRDSIKRILTDSRKPVHVDRQITPLAANGDALFYFRYDYAASPLVEKLYRKTGDGKEKQVKLGGSPVLSSAKAIDGELYFVREIESRVELAAYHLKNGTVRQVAKITDWKPADGWVTGIKQLDGELYVVLHVGDLTMGSESLYKVEGGSLKKASSAKSYISYVKSGNYLYMTDFTPMFSAADNLYRVDLAKGTSSKLGVPGFAYGINRTVTEGGGVGLSGVDALYVKDGYLYTLGYNNEAANDESAVYRINPADNTQARVTPPTHRFWLQGDRILYLDAATGYLESVKLDGTDKQTLVKRRAQNVSIQGSEVYFTDNADNDVFGVGVLYRYSLTDQKETRLSELSVVSYNAGKTGIYYWSQGYEPGIYRVEPDGRNTRLVSDSVESVVPTEQGLLYTLTYKDGVFAVK
ncbi:DUF5050 domain-containing protein [Paenibacillus aurantiacus]|uniref:DUF5050 domain-containing protein n=1 Tax=Paenibacillus aurantiacus TaxID=1936118 RepID=A0ABV5KVA2_9BACL